MKKPLQLCLAVTVTLLLHTGPALAQPPELTAKSAILIEASTGKILYDRRSQERRPPASTTKMMTLITALEHGKLDDIVTASEVASQTEGSTLWLAPGEQLKMQDLLYGVMLVSGNDATVAVAEHISGSVGKFAELMTAKAKAIGAVDTHFTNSNGLPDPQHYSTARDLAFIAAYGYKNPLFAEIITTPSRTMPWAGKDHEREIFNENKLLWQYEGANGVKTGYTDEAGPCLVSAAKRNGIQLIAVVLDSDYMWTDSIALLDYGFRQVRSQPYFQQGDVLRTIRVANGKTESIPLAVKDSLAVPVFEEGGVSDYHTVLEVPNRVEAPIRRGQKVGVVKTLFKEKEIAVIDLVAADSSEKKSLWSLVWTSLRSLVSNLMQYLA
ncbi:D-alanyl-D-alanine carboxypeptidase [Anaerosporomusa subterranea]|uniref:serine-type D-Ala-D-Ala carboxypeptidase n=1 Tax=Anaerosporomusa subterranea TaxID=1794912 RepID=A0A154BVG2_ANASB|nr:D-alanyl-D-alanine carboxypeptidase family protein [Anaerosporomusa subterranea]KYZ77478.1 D-alanyl-D-alanine carboxypeptidase [Anaerosporomusa subterranea]